MSFTIGGVDVFKAGRDVPLSPKLRLAVAVAMAAGIALSGCGSSSRPASDAQTLADSVTNLGNQSSLSIKFSLGDVTLAQLQQLSTTGGGKALSTADAQTLLESALFLDVASGSGESLSSSKFSTDSANVVDLGVSVGSAAPVEFRYVGQNVYLHLTLSSVASQLGISSATLTKLANQLAAANAFVPGLGALAQGAWVELPKSGIESLGSVASVLGSGKVNPSTVAVGDASIFRTDLAAALAASSSVTFVGTSGGRSQYSAILNLNNLGSKVLSLLKQNLSGLPAGLGSSQASKLGATSTSKLPSAATFTLYVAGNSLVELDVNLNQLNPTSPAIPLRLTFGQAPTISAPGGATTLDLSKLPALIAGLVGGSTTTTPAG